MTTPLLTEAERTAMPRTVQPGGCAWILSWVMDGLMHPKLILCVFVIPIMIGYIGYRAYRILSDRQSVVLRDHGMHVTRGETQLTFAWTDIRQLIAAHIGDMVDEDSIDIQLHSGRSAIRFTRAHFPNLETLWERIVQKRASRWNRATSSW